MTLPGYLTGGDWQPSPPMPFGHFNNDPTSPGAQPAHAYTDSPPYWGCCGPYAHIAAEWRRFDATDFGPAIPDYHENGPLLLTSMGRGPGGGAIPVWEGHPTYPISGDMAVVDRDGSLLPGGTFDDNIWSDVCSTGNNNFPHLFRLGPRWFSAYNPWSDFNDPTIPIPGYVNPWQYAQDHEDIVGWEIEDRYYALIGGRVTDTQYSAWSGSDDYASYQNYVGAVGPEASFTRNGFVDDVSVDSPAVYRLKTNLWSVNAGINGHAAIALIPESNQGTIEAEIAGGFGVVYTHHHPTQLDNSAFIVAHGPNAQMDHMDQASWWTVDMNIPTDDQYHLLLNVWTSNSHSQTPTHAAYVEQFMLPGLHTYVRSSQRWRWLYAVSDRTILAATAPPMRVGSGPAAMLWT